MSKILDVARDYFIYVKENEKSRKKYKAFVKKRKRLSRLWVVPINCVPVESDIMIHDANPPIYAFLTPEGKLVYSKRYNTFFRITHIFDKTQYEKDIWISHNRRHGD